MPSLDSNSLFRRNLSTIHRLQRLNLRCYYHRFFPSSNTTCQTSANNLHNLPSISQPPLVPNRTIRRSTTASLSSSASFDSQQRASTPTNTAVNTVSSLLPLSW
ncbi:hypothetical protein RYX36_028839 [Vicia faba]